MRRATAAWKAGRPPITVVVLGLLAATTSLRVATLDRTARGFVTFCHFPAVSDDGR
jgi:hypothetical protein